MLRAKGKQDWGTPKWLFLKLNETYKFTLDAAADDTNMKCDKYYTEVQDGLVQDWDSATFVNPPFKHIRLWVNKAVEEQKKMHHSVVIAPLLSLTAKWYKNIKDSCHTIILCPRVAFVGPSSSPNGGIMLLEFGKEHLGEISWKDITSWKI